MIWGYLDGPFNGLRQIGHYRVKDKSQPVKNISADATLYLHGLSLDLLRTLMDLCQALQVRKTTPSVYTYRLRHMTMLFEGVFEMFHKGVKSKEHRV